MGCPKLGWTIVFEWDGALPQRTDSQTMAMLHALNYSHIDIVDQWPLDVLLVGSKMNYLIFT